ncbi:hypothetical protein K2Z84_27640 [Candidatus Binatia bacterium]|nr:hypothetical protein [Candidatus Binatia bacterium]
MNPLQRVLAKLTNVTQQSNGGYQASCPAHDDEHPSLSVGVGTDGRVLLKCFAGCAAEEVVAAVDLKMADLFAAEPDTSQTESAEPAASAKPAGLCLADYAAAKGLDLNFLARLGVTEIAGKGSRSVRLPYNDERGQQVSTRRRIALVGRDRFLWTKGSKVIPYGLWKLDHARECGRITIVEGESDCHTLWQHDEPAIGSPGADAWQDSWGAHLHDILTVYVVQEPDKGGLTLVTKLAQSAEMRSRLRIVSLAPHKDPNELYLADRENFPAAWAAALAGAHPLEDRTIGTNLDEATLLKLAGHLLDNPAIFDEVGRVLSKYFWAGDTRVPRLAYLGFSSRFRPRPLNIALVGPSASGKSEAVRVVLPFFPDEAYYFLAAMSEKALVYTSADFKQKIIFLAEADSLTEDGAGASAVRSILTDNRMVYEVTVRNEQTGDFTTQRIEKEGPTGMITTSTESLRTQLATRHLEDSVVDTPKQTQAIMDKQAERAAGLTGPPPDLTPFRAQQQWLTVFGAKGVVVPFAPALSSLVPATDVRMRRDFPQLLTAVETVAFLRQRLRDRTPAGEVIATVDDYAVARGLLLPIFTAVATEGVTEVIRETVNAVPSGGATLSELARALKLAKSTVDYRVTQAVARGFLTKDEATKRLGRGEPLPDRVEALPDPEDVRRVYERSNVSGEEPPPPSPSSGVELLAALTDSTVAATRVYDFLRSQSVCAYCGHVSTEEEDSVPCRVDGHPTRNLHGLLAHFEASFALRSALGDLVEETNPEDPTFPDRLVEILAAGASGRPGLGAALLRYFKLLDQRVSFFRTWKASAEPAPSAALH